MVFSIASRSVQAASRRAVTAAVPTARTAALTPARFYSDKSSPEAKASSLIDMLPGNSLVSKTTWVTLGAGLTAFTVSNELYVANDETVIAAGFLVFAFLIGKAVSKPYSNWADSTIEKYTNILNEARAGHTKAVQDRIDTVAKQKDVVGSTKELYNLAKDTVNAEQEAFELKQRVQMSAEIRNVLDSWSRYEAQQRESEQKMLTESVIMNVQKALLEEKTQKQVLDGALGDLEKLVKDKAI
ncbi:atp4 subunit B of the stator stalk of mitochondrial F1F0 ATP synthase [Malassezia vespertilionis]|uniref:ATP synthase subunit 4 n=1 Tax=Malassezia vespertilionis TaxID=2020962 RepID=A0A2N1JEH8_9BASI|nr:atp4 subunit B of the stator stalk of mitochondrial F1F0 ATP synthase [Malassezia vespertilionis]PKI84947.1 Atp4p [Malassezia vespertilionis]WFD05543.1 atp4 subunit B of the stator stalk of mitochondrial F1F0 ATP synthase [Malassezia vespertilionis]